MSVPCGRHTRSYSPHWYTTDVHPVRYILPLWYTQPSSGIIPLVYEPLGYLAWYFHPCRRDLVPGIPIPTNGRHMKHTHSPLWREWQTSMKTLPSLTSLAGSNGNGKESRKCGFWNAWDLSTSGSGSRCYQKNYQNYHSHRIKDLQSFIN